MTIVNYTISPSQGDSWSGTFDVVLGDPVELTVPTSITVTNPSFSFSPNATNGVQRYSGSGTKYVTWRSQNTVSQYPTSGFSFDIWSDELYDAVIAGTTWNVVRNNTYNLRSDKWTLVYNYNAPSSIVYCRGGTITFTP